MAPLVILARPLLLELLFAELASVGLQALVQPHVGFQPFNRFEGAAASLVVAEIAGFIPI